MVSGITSKGPPDKAAACVLKRAPIRYPKPVPTRLVMTRASQKIKNFEDEEVFNPTAQ